MDTSSTNSESTVQQTEIKGYVNTSFKTPLAIRNLQIVSPISIKRKLNNTSVPIKPTDPLRVGATEVYKVIQKATGALGGNGSNGAIYGELTIGSMQKIIKILVEKCDLNSDSRFIDVGSGLGKPNFHVAQYPGIKLSIGVELEEIRWQVFCYLDNYLKFLSYLVYIFIFNRNIDCNYYKNNIF
jgi:hypothetical protein